MMMKTTAVAPGKIILFGEHAVVYGQPAIAIPVSQVAATAVVETAEHERVLLSAPDLGEDYWLDQVPADHPLGAALWALWGALPADTPPPSHMHITVTSTIPIASGLGSGAAIAAALIRAVANHIGRADLAEPAEVSRLTYEVERIHHGTPSGIDNTVVSYQKPVYFVRDLAKLEPDVEATLREGGRVQLYPPVLDTIVVGRPYHFLIGDTGVQAPTKEAVGDIRRAWLANPQVDVYFDGLGQIAERAHSVLHDGDTKTLGQLMSVNHTGLQELGLSSPELDRLVDAAMSAGALGAKLSGGGRGGNMIALVTKQNKRAVTDALYKAGAKSVFETVLPPSS